MTTLLVTVLAAREPSELEVQLWGCGPLTKDRNLAKPKLAAFVVATDCETGSPRILGYLMSTRPLSSQVTFSFMNLIEEKAEAEGKPRGECILSTD